MYGDFFSEKIDYLFHSIQLSDWILALSCIVL